MASSSPWKKAAQLVAAVALIALAVVLHMFRSDPKLAGPVGIVVGAVFLLAIGVMLRERIRRDGARGWWAVLGTLGIPAALFGHVLFWGSHVVLEPRYRLAMGLAVGGTLAVAFGFRRSRNPRLSRVLGGMGALSLLAKIIAMRPILPVRSGPNEWYPVPAPWTDVGMMVPALGALVVLVIIARPMRATEEQQPAAF